MATHSAVLFFTKPLASSFARCRESARAGILVAAWSLPKESAPFASARKSSTRRGCVKPVASLKIGYDRLRSSPEDQAQCFDNFLGSTFARPRGRPVFHAAANPSASQQSARFQSAQVLAGCRHGQAHALGDRGYGLVWLPDQESECLQAFAVSQNTAGAPKRRLTRKRHSGSHTPHFAKCDQLVNAAVWGVRR